MRIKQLKQLFLEKWSGGKSLFFLVIDFLFFLQGIGLLCSTPAEAKVLSLFFILPIILERINPVRLKKTKYVILACGIFFFSALSIMILLFFQEYVFTVISVIDICLYASSLVLLKRLCHTGCKGQH